MVSGLPPDPSQYSGQHVHSRRRFISEYLRYLGGDASAKWNDSQRIAFETTMMSLNERGLTQVSHHWLEYEADCVAWYKLFNSFNVDVVEWPFSASGDAPDDIAHGISPTYQKWRLDRELPISDSTKLFGSVTATVLSLSQRQKVWDNPMQYPSNLEAPITGPFQFALPVWVDIDNLVFGKDERLLDKINQDIVPPHLAVSWHNENEGYITLVVGFSPTTCIDPGDEGVERSIRYLWQSVVDWGVEAYEGGTMTLATFLLVRKAVPVAGDTDYSHMRILEMVGDLSDDARKDVLGFMRKAQKKRDYIAQCREGVLQIIQKPLTEAKAELSRWVWRGAHALDCLGTPTYERRLAAAREIWLSNTTDERTIQEICAWAWGPHNMAV